MAAADSSMRLAVYEAIIASTDAATFITSLEAAGYCVAPLDPDHKMQMAGGAKAQGMGIDDESPVVLAYFTYRAMIAARPK